MEVSAGGEIVPRPRWGQQGENEAAWETKNDSLDIIGGTDGLSNGRRRLGTKGSGWRGKAECFKSLRSCMRECLGGGWVVVSQASAA